MNLHTWSEIEFRTAQQVSQLSPYGCAVNLLTSVPSYRKASFESVAKHIGLALQFAQLNFYFASDGRPTGMVIWAWLAAKVQTRLVLQGATVPELHPSEWKEGARLHVLTLVALSGSLRPTVRLFRAQMAEHNDALYWVSRRRGLMRAKLRS